MGGQVQPQLKRLLPVLSSPKTKSLEEGTMRTPPLLKYERQLARLFQLRALGPVADEIEERIAEALNDCRSEMTEDEEGQIATLIAKMRDHERSNAAGRP